MIMHSSPIRRAGLTTMHWEAHHVILLKDCQAILCTGQEPEWNGRLTDFCFQILSAVIGIYILVNTGKIIDPTNTLHSKISIVRCVHHPIKEPG